MLSGTFASAFAAATELVQPHSLIVDGSLPKAQVDAQNLAARRYDTFWSTGDEALALIEGRNYSPSKFLEQIKLDFDQLYEEAGRRRMMAVSAHDRISGTPQMVRVWDAFLHYAKSGPGVAFLRKDEITRFVLQSLLTLRESETI